MGGVKDMYFYPHFVYKGGLSTNVDNREMGEGESANVDSFFFI